MIRRFDHIGGRLSGRVRAFSGDATGAAVVEFALFMPVLILILLAGFEIAQALSVDRKVTDTTAELASIISEQPSPLTSSAVQSFMTDTSEIMKPFSNTNLSITMSEVTTSSTCTAGNCPTTYNWVQSQSSGNPGANGTVISGSTPFTGLPTSLQVPSTSYILVQTTYTYNPTVGTHYVGSIPLAAQLYISPRRATTILCTDC